MCLYPSSRITSYRITGFEPYKGKETGLQKFTGRNGTAAKQGYSQFLPGRCHRVSDMKITELLAKLEAYHTPLDDNRRTCDGIIYGNPEQECSGVVTTCCPTAAVIQKAANMGYNLIIAHEPTFFDGWDETDWLQNDRVYHAKKKLLDETGVVVYRNHDRLHGESPDGIFSGLIQALGWEQYETIPQKDVLGFRFTLPETTVADVARHVAEVLHIRGIRILGDPGMKVTRVGIAAHFLGTEMDRIGINFINSFDCELLIPGEIIDWTIGEYIADANALGFKKAILNVGHFNLEEPGMEHMARWLPDVIGKEVPVAFIQSGDSFRWLDFSKA